LGNGGGQSTLSGWNITFGGSTGTQFILHKGNNDPTTIYSKEVIQIDNGSSSAGLKLLGNTIQRYSDNKFVLFEGDVYTKAHIDSLAASTFSLNQKLYTWTNSTSFSLSSITRNSDGAIVTGTAVWPDGSTGSFITDTLSTLFPGAIDAFHVTYVPASGPTKTITQSLLTRDASGAVTAQPVLTITP
jgi:hypothetical protein